MFMLLCQLDPLVTKKKPSRWVLIERRKRCFSQMSTPKVLKTSQWSERKELIAKPNIDGFLVGGASLKPSFMEIVTAVQWELGILGFLDFFAREQMWTDQINMTTDDVWDYVQRFYNDYTHVYHLISYYLIYHIYIYMYIHSVYHFISDGERC